MRCYFNCFKFLDIRNLITCIPLPLCLWLWMYLLKHTTLNTIFRPQSTLVKKVTGLIHLVNEFRTYVCPFQITYDTYEIIHQFLTIGNTYANLLILGFKWNFVSIQCCLLLEIFIFEYILMHCKLNPLSLKASIPVHLSMLTLMIIHYTTVNRLTLASCYL